LVRSFAVNHPAPDSDESGTRGQAVLTGAVHVKSIRPEDTEPIPVRAGPGRMGTVIVRFVALLVVAIVALVLAWYR
jgi:hypothetical protein